MKPSHARAASLYPVFSVHTQSRYRARFQNAADIHHIHKIKQCAVRNTGKRDPMFRTIEAFGSEHRIEHFVSGLILCLILSYLILHAV